MTGLFPEPYPVTMDDGLAEWKRKRHENVVDAVVAFDEDHMLDLVGDAAYGALLVSGYQPCAPCPAWTKRDHINALLAALYELINQGEQKWPTTPQ